MMLTVEKSIGALRPDSKGRPMAAGPASSQEHPVLSTMVSWMENRHTLLLRACLESPEVTSEGVRLFGATALMGRIASPCEELRRQARLLYAEFREKWKARLASNLLLPFLERNQWIVPHPEGGVALPGKGSRKEAKTLYLQVLHDMGSDCSRQWAMLAGRLQSLQTVWAAEWHQEAIVGDATKVIPTLEAALRAGEFEAWKSLRQALGEFSEDAFIRSVGRWENRRFLNGEALVREAALAWRGAGPGDNGFIGFMQALAGLGERLALTMIDHYENKWDLLLRGFAESRGEGRGSF